MLCGVGIRRRGEAADEAEVLGNGGEEDEAECELVVNGVGEVDAAESARRLREGDVESQKAWE